MMYCPDCQLLIGDNDYCPICYTRKIRQPKENDVIFLTTQNWILSEILEDILTQNNIPCLVQGKRTGRTDSSRLSNVFVPYGAYKKAKELLEEFFNEEENQSEENREEE